MLVRVVLPEPPYGPYDYTIPQSLRDEVQPGRRLRVPVGRGNRKMVGYAVIVGDSRSLGDSESRIRWKDIHSVVDSRPLLSSVMLRLTQWMSDYYLCPWGQVLESVVPAGVRAQAGTREIELFSVPSSVAGPAHSIEITEEAGRNCSYTCGFTGTDDLAATVGEGELRPRPVKALVEKQLVVVERRRVMASPTPLGEGGSRYSLETQPATARSIAVDPRSTLWSTASHDPHSRRHRQRQDGSLHPGDRGSLRFGRQAIVLVPEISLTPQTEQRFRSPLRASRGAAQPSDSTPSGIGIGSGSPTAKCKSSLVRRSAVFAPTPQSGADRARRRARGVVQAGDPRRATTPATWRWYGPGAENVPLVLGSATPSLESWRHRAQARRAFGCVDAATGPRSAAAGRRHDRPARSSSRIVASRGAISRQLHRRWTERLRTTAR